MYAVICNSDDTLMYLSEEIEITESHVLIDNTIVPLEQVKKINENYYIEIENAPVYYPDKTYVFSNGDFIVKEKNGSDLEPNNPYGVDNDTYNQIFSDIAEEVANNGY